jgi:hypothetical protein
MLVSKTGKTKPDQTGTTTTTSPSPNSPRTTASPALAYHAKSLADAVVVRIARLPRRMTPNPPRRDIRMLPVDTPTIVSAESLKSSRRAVMTKRLALSLF